jgi:sugar phosphate isomerase/epimerase
MSHSWLSAPEDLEADNQQIIQAKKLAYLLCPANARLRIVGLAPTGGLDPQAAVANVERYRSLLPNCPMVFAVENSRQPATFTLDLAVQGGALLTYDEANTYRDDGTTVNPPEVFWNAVKMEDLTSVHFKQKTADGVLTQVGDGYVDFAAIGKRLVAGGYKGDLLLENTPTDQPLEDAVSSRVYLSSLL